MALEMEGGGEWPFGKLGGRVRNLEKSVNNRKRGRSDQNRLGGPLPMIDSAEEVVGGVEAGGNTSAYSGDKTPRGEDLFLTYPTLIGQKNKN